MRTEVNKVQRLGSQTPCHVLVGVSYEAWAAAAAAECFYFKHLR